MFSVFSNSNGNQQYAEDRGKGSVILSSLEGKVEIFKTFAFDEEDLKNPSFVPNENESYKSAIVGEFLGTNAVIKTGKSSNVSLLFTNGAIAQLEEESILKITQMDQVDFKGSSKKTNHLTAEISRSVIVLDLQEGDLVVEVKKLHKKSLFQVNTQHFQAGIRGTMFKAYPVHPSPIWLLWKAESKSPGNGNHQNSRWLAEIDRPSRQEPEITQLSHIERANIQNVLERHDLQILILLFFPIS